MEGNFHKVRQLVAIASSSCMGLAGFCGLLWGLKGAIDFHPDRCGKIMLSLILLDLKLFIRVVLAKQGMF